MTPTLTDRLKLWTDRLQQAGHRPVRYKTGTQWGWDTLASIILDMGDGQTGSRCEACGMKFPYTKYYLDEPFPECKGEQE